MTTGFRKNIRRSAALAAALLGTAFLPAWGGPADTTQHGPMDATRHQKRLGHLLAAMGRTVTRGPFQATDDSLNAHKTPDWYADAKFGIFIHYGLFSVPQYSGVGCWYGNNMYIPDSGANAFHEANFGPVDRFGYKDLAPHLTASAFRPDDWIGLFKEAGARFVVPVSCFHDGFAMWNSGLTDWNAVQVGPHRDYDGLLAAAARKQGLKFGVAWHAFFRPGFFGPGRRPGTDIGPPDAGTPWSFYGPATVTPDFVDDSLGRLTELVEGYHPDLVWFDFDTQFVPPAQLRRFAAFYYNSAAGRRQAVVINDKHAPTVDGVTTFPPRAVALDYERGKSGGLKPDVWQTDTSVSWRDWSYIPNDSFKTTDELVHELVDIVSKNGVLLLDVGPRADGTIPPEPRALLRGVGAWLKVNGEAIYGTRPCWALGFGEGTGNSGGGGFSDRPVDYTARDFRFTQKGRFIYAVAMTWPAVEDHFFIRAFGRRAAIATGGISDVRMLGTAAPLTWKQTAQGLWVRRPARRPCDSAYVFRITVGGVSVERMTAERLDDHHLRVAVRVRDLDVRPVRLPLTFRDNETVIGTRTVSLRAGETATQTVTLNAPARPGMERITVAAPGSPPFVPQTELLNPPAGLNGRTFTGTSMLAGRDLGRQGRFTLTFWTRTDSLPDAYAALFNTAGWAPGGMHVQFLADGTLQVSFNNAQGHGVDVRGSAAPGAVREWQFIAVTYDAATGDAVLYVNGTRDVEAKVGDPTPVDLSRFTLGRWTAGRRRFTGQMADVRLYGHVLTTEQVRALCLGRPQPSSDDLLAAWDMADGQAITDTAGHGHDLAVEPAPH